MTNTETKLILNEIFSDFQSITQWISSDLQYSSKYQIKANALIDILEDSYFGKKMTHFKRGMKPFDKSCGNNLYDRFYFIVKQMKMEKEIHKQCYFDIESMFIYYKKLSELRESFNN